MAKFKKAKNNTFSSGKTNEDNIPYNATENEYPKEDSSAATTPVSPCEERERSFSDNQFVDSKKIDRLIPSLTIMHTDSNDSIDSIFIDPMITTNQPLLGNKLDFPKVLSFRKI